MIRYSPATGRSDLVLLQAETNPGEPRFLYSAPGDFGTLAMSPNGKWLLVGWVNADQWLFLRLNARQGEGGLEHRRAVRRLRRPGAAREERSRKACQLVLPASP